MNKFLGKVGIYDRLPLQGPRFYEQGKRLKNGLSIKKTVSVITVVYNNANMLQRCINSVVESTYWEKIEYIIIDGGSNDGTLDVIKKNISYIDYAVSEKDRGIYHAMNKGLSLCSGDYIALINSDDWLESDGIEIAVNAIKENNAEIGIGFANIWDANDKFSHIWKIGNFDVRILLSGMSFCHQALIASRKAYEMAGLYDESMLISSDYKWVKSLFRARLPFVFIEKPIVNFSFNGISANNRLIWKEECKQLVYQEYPNLDYSDISPFLEYIYNDGPLDPNAITNIVKSSTNELELLQSIALVILDKLRSLELKTKNVACLANITPLKSVSLSHNHNHNHNMTGLERSHCFPNITLIEARKDFSINKPKISTVIPVYKVEDWVEECALSVINQDFDDIEIIFVNDGSPDDSQRILERLHRKDDRIHIIVKENGGLSSARNVGMNYAKGDYIHFLDSDDYIKQGMYSEMYMYAYTNDCDIVKSNLGFIDDIYPTKVPVLPKNKEVFNIADCHSYLGFISPCASLYKKNLLKKTGMFEEGITYEDRPFNWETLLLSERIGHINKTYYMYRVSRPGSIMSKKGNISHFDAFKSLDVLTRFLSKHKFLEMFNVEYVKEQLRIYSMLIDINAIPKVFIGDFYSECVNRIKRYPVNRSIIYDSNLPIRVKHLYSFLLDSFVPEGKLNQREEGEAYFFKGINYLSYSKKYSASSCELYLVAKNSIDKKFLENTKCRIAIFKKALISSTIYEYIHFQKGSTYLGEVLNKLNCFFAYISNNKHFNTFLKKLHNTSSIMGEKVIHLSFLSSDDGNYFKCKKMVDFYLKRNNVGNFKTLDFGEIQLALESADVKFYESYREIISKIKSMGLRSQAFSTQTFLRMYLNDKLDENSVRTLTIYSPRSTPENYLMELFNSNKVKKIFVPHGLPQVSSLNINFDYVLALTMSKAWREAFPKSKVVHIGWSESFDCSEIYRVENHCKGAKKIQFLSQLTGERIHRLYGFRSVIEFFIKEALTLENKSYEFDIRLRDEGELLDLEPVLRKQVDNSDFMNFSFISDCSMNKSDADLLVSSSSTALLYSQYLNIPALQLTTDRILQHWPFDIVTPNRVYLINETKESFVSFLERLIYLKNNKMVYLNRVGSKESINKIMHHIYNVKME